MIIKPHKALSIPGWDAAYSYVWDMNARGIGEGRYSSRFGTCRTGASPFPGVGERGFPAKVWPEGRRRVWAHRRCLSAPARELTGLGNHQESSEEFHEFEEYRSKHRNWHDHVKTPLQQKEKEYTFSQGER